MNKTIKTFALLSVMLVAFSCNNMQEQQTDTTTTAELEKEGDVITKSEQAALTPDDVIQILKEGNERYVNNNLTNRDYMQQVSNAVEGQFPEAIILSCVDSRVPVEYVFDKGIGDVFVARVAGNFVNEDILGSMEFATKVSGSKLVLVLGHEHCGAVKAAIDDVELGNITPMLSKIRPSVEAVEYDGDRTSENEDFVHMVCETNVEMTIEQIRKDSPIMAEMEENGEIKIVGGIYDLDTGEVTFL
ncbi:MAG: carbonic anhydrase family protein [Bacteroidales bacterium]